MGWLVDRYGVKWPYAICFALWCSATALTGSVTTLQALIVMRLLIGSAEAIVVPASYRWMGNNFKESQKGFAVGLFTFWYDMTSFKNSLLAGAAALAAWVFAAIGWRRARREGRSAWLFVLPALHLNLLLAALLALGRYSVPVLPALLVLSAFGIDAVLPGREAQRA